MCASCGCGEHLHEHDRDHEHGHSDPEHGHPHAGEHTHEHDGHEHRHRTVAIEQEILAKNDRLAAQNRGWLDGRAIAAVNLMSSPGAGKTTLLQRTIRHLGGSLPISVIEGDQETQRDADRIRAAGARAVQINTGTGCHLDAAMVARALRRLDPAAGSLLFIENVGNLVCPALFALGERARVVIASVTEGDDKPLKYPHMFRAADLVVLNKLDLLPYVDFDPDRFFDCARAISPRVEVVRLSATRGEGLVRWYDWLRALGQRRVAAE
jgi:hydrogenase nickel incorporation protein HypB